MFKRGSYLYYALGNGMFYFSWAMFSCIISVYLAGIDCSATEISLITSAAALFAMATQPITGFLADKFRSPKKVAMITGVLTIIFGLMFAYTRSFIFLFLFNGFTQGCLNGITALTDRLATAAPYPFGTIRVWGSILYAIAAQVSGIVYDYVAPVANFYIFAAGLVIMIFSLYMMNDAKPIVVNKVQKVTTKEVITHLWKNKSFKIFLLIFILFQGPSSAQQVYLPLVIRGLGGTTTIVGTTLLLSTLSEIPAVLFSDRYMKVISYKKLMIFACVLSIIRFVWYSSCPNPYLIMSVFFFQGLTTIVFTLVAVRIVLDLVEEQYVNSAYGISSMLAKGFSALIFQFVGGRILDLFPGNNGYTIMYLVFTTSIVLALILCFKFKFKKRDLRYK
ncbi:MFS transporter [uncultured Thomasclavelia sp.]|uniref:MFS transporter n=1 Tax=uncultured Thomasclavelia sp. TaxID=3025759 RepID=UPI0025F30A96|nr:MFS transporter [uncultured Thomasclavelia sp.]